MRCLGAELILTFALKPPAVSAAAAPVPPSRSTSKSGSCARAAAPLTPHQAEIFSFHAYPFYVATKAQVGQVPVHLFIDIGGMSTWRVASESPAETLQVQ